LTNVKPVSVQKVVAVLKRHDPFSVSRPASSKRGYVVRQTGAAVEVQYYGAGRVGAEQRATLMTTAKTVLESAGILCETRAPLSSIDLPRLLCTAIKEE
jgi:hypothetical protein